MEVGMFRRINQGNYVAIPAEDLRGGTYWVRYLVRASSDFW